MGTIDVTNTILTTAMFGGFLKVLFIILELVYLFYAFMITRQLNIMNRSFNTPAAPLFTSMALFHFIATVVIVCITILLS